MPNRKSASRLGSFRGQLTLWFAGLALLILGSVGFYVGHLATETLVRSGGEALYAHARSAASLLGDNLQDRQKEIYLLSTSTLLTRGDLKGADVRQMLELRQKVRPEYSWLGVTDPQGNILQSTGGNLLGQNVAQRPWFVGALQGAFVGDMHEAVLLAKLLPNRQPEQPLRFIDFATPIRDDQGKLRGILGSHVDWYWVTDIVQSVIPVPAQSQGVEVLVFDREGNVLYPFSMIGTVRLPEPLGNKEHHKAIVWSDGKEYLGSMVDVAAETPYALGWRVVVRQPADTALQPSKRLRNQLLVLGFIAAIVFAVLAYRFAVRISRPVEQLAEAVHSIEKGERDPVYPGGSQMWEIERLSQSIQSMTGMLLQQEQSLKRLNASLEAQVIERTAELSAANLELAKQASRDGLTGIFNRQHFDERLLECFRTCQRNGRGFALLLIDVDHFKRVNDTYGHLAGDEVLRQVARLLMQTVRSNDFVARYGGEEFVILLPETTNVDEAQVVAEKIGQAVAATTFAEAGTLTVSLGLSVADASDASSQEIVERADQALYEAKAQGRNRVRVRLRS